MFFYTFWLFLLYSFGGYLLEKLYAWARRSSHRVRKCFLLLPLCPVYGLALLAVLALPPSLRSGWPLYLWGGLTATLRNIFTTGGGRPFWECPSGTTPGFLEISVVGCVCHFPWRGDCCCSRLSIW